jgi:hypothetical protein
MTSNGKPQFSTNIFQNRSNGVLTDAVNATVVQDKTALTRGRAASAQPEPREKAARSRGTNNKTARSKKHGSSKRKTVHLVLWVKPIVKSELQRIAEQEGLSMSKAGAAFLERALQQNIDMNYHPLLHPVIKTAIREEMQGISSRLAWLLVRVAFDTGQTRALVTNILGRQQGMTEDMLKNILAMSQQTAKGNITRKTPQLTELMEAVEKWLYAEDEEKKPSN